MERLIIEQTKATPQIDFDADQGLLSIKGQSYPENAFKFYETVFQWLEQFFKVAEAGKRIIFEFSMPYINTSSSKCIIILLEKLEEANGAGKQIVVNWYYDEENDYELECAEEFKEFVNLEFNIISLTS
jgi:hypothetical protein